MDASMFMRTILTDAEDDTARLVFADWLEETGNDSNAEWAKYIRINDEMGRLSASDPRFYKLKLALGPTAARIRVRLTLQAGLLLNHFAVMLRLLPAKNFRLDISHYEIPLPVVQLVPLSVAEENLVMPIQIISDHSVFRLAASASRMDLIMVSEHPVIQDTIDKFAMIFCRNVWIFRAVTGQVRQAVERYYGPLDQTENVDSDPLP